jgi:hypothetical protein
LCEFGLQTVVTLPDDHERDEQRGDDDGGGKRTEHKEAATDSDPARLASLLKFV